MDEKKYPQMKSHGDGNPPWCCRFLGANTVFENGSAGHIIIGKNVGIGPKVKTIMSTHDISVETGLSIVKRPLVFGKVVLGDGCDIGVNA